MALTDFLKGIADAIRTKDGTTAPIPASEFAQRILTLPVSGSSVPSGMAVGSFTLSDDSNTVRIEHNLGVVPQYAFLCTLEPTQMNYSMIALSKRMASLPDWNVRYVSDAYAVNAYNAKEAFIDATKSVITAQAVNNNYYFRSGYTYFWCVFG